LLSPHRCGVWLAATAKRRAPAYAESSRAPGAASSPVGPDVARTYWGVGWLADGCQISRSWWLPGFAGASRTATKVRGTGSVAPTAAAGPLPRCDRNRRILATEEEVNLMKLLRRFRPSPALVVACLALALSLGGAGYAASRLPANSVGTKQVINHSLLKVDFKPGQLTRGPRGPTGATGATGATGTTGATGPMGPAGIALIGA